MWEVGDGELNQRGEAGFTLIEALVTLSIMALLSMIVFPQLERAADVMTMRRTIALLASDMRRTRAVAILSGTEADLVVSADGRGYHSSDGEMRVLPANTSLHMAGRYVAFFGDGSSSGGGMALVSRRVQMDLFVDPVTGAIQLRRRM